MRARGSWLAVLGLSLLGSAPGCSPAGFISCTQIGCDSGLGVELRGEALAGVDGPFTVRVCAAGECTESEQLGAAVASVVQLFHMLPDAADGDELTVRVEVADREGVAFSAVRTSRLRAERPNGPRCGPACNQAFLTFGS